ncbi:MAG: DUF3667 domain-containing protein [Rheinheimera sp.]
MSKQVLIAEPLENAVSDGGKPQPLRLCVSCQAPVTTPFCGHCGRKVQQHSVMFDTAVHTVQILMNIDGRWRRTLRDLFIRPGQLLQLYLNGQRHLYANPVLMLLVLSSLTLALTEFLKVDYYQYSSDERLVELIQSITMFSGYISVVSNLITAMLSRALFPGTLWSERFVILTYASVFSGLISFPLLLVAYLLGHDLSNSYLSWVGLLSACWIYWSLQPSVKRVIQIFVLNFVVFMLFFTLLGIGAGIYVVAEDLLAPLQHLPQLLNPEPLY